MIHASHIDLYLVQDTRGRRIDRVTLALQPAPATPRIKMFHLICVSTGTPPSQPLRAWLRVPNRGMPLSITGRRDAGCGTRDGELPRLWMGIRPMGSMGTGCVQKEWVLCFSPRDLFCAGWNRGPRGVCGCIYVYVNTPCHGPRPGSHKNTTQTCTPGFTPRNGSPEPEHQPSSARQRRAETVTLSSKASRSVGHRDPNIRQRFFPIPIPRRARHHRPSLADRSPPTNQFPPERKLRVSPNATSRTESPRPDTTTTVRTPRHTAVQTPGTFPLAHSPESPPMNGNNRSSENISNTPGKHPRAQDLTITYHLHM
ncbi:uncharacterized protein B0H64DRAFT_55580 [Chaetomium fimeti]|uniref:Uncharacterized protein n=1 Tax=Chaetomium fimeti TaxID=1854472 RepID=A0AAE0H6S6_9PEZI|nr:hypothetical protein B0H64DRAFT_55580 [Chaetomium fimeti]